MGRPKLSYTTQQHQHLSLIDGDEAFFSLHAAPPPEALVATFPPDPEKNPLISEEAWVDLRSRALAPKHVSDLVTTHESRAEFIEGMRLLRLDGERAKIGASPQPQQLLIADMLTAGHKRNAVLVPRRSSKSTSAIAVGVGRAAHRDDYRVGVFTLTSGKAGRSRFLKDVAPHVERLYPTKIDRPFRLSRIAGMEGLMFPNGGSIHWLSTLDDIRGEAFDFLLLDEAGEPADPAYVSEVLSAALPTMDTRPGAQLVALGTAGRYREGNLLWEALELGRNGIGGIVEYAAPDGLTDSELDDWEPTAENPEGRVRELVEVTHPGVNTLTTLDSIRENFHSLGAEKFGREYLGIFGIIGDTSGVIDATKWAEAGSGAELPTPPADFQLAFSTHPDQISGSVMAAWRDRSGRAHLQLLEHKKNITWMGATLKQISRKYQKPVVYDSGSPGAQLIMDELARARPRPRTDPHGFMDVKKAAALLVEEIVRGNLTHYRQPELDNAARRAVKRSGGSANGWAFGRGKDYNLDITPIEAGALALLAYDLAKKPERSRAPSVTFA